MANDGLFGELEARVEELGFEVVDLERAGDSRRPILRLRVDRPGSEPGSGVSLEDCTRVSRALEPFLDEREDLPATYVLEVSSPGVERPLVRRRDWARFAGHTVAVKGRGPLAGRGGRVTGTLLGVEGGEAEGEGEVQIRLENGEEVRVPLADIKSANLVFQWGDRRSSD